MDPPICDDIKDNINEYELWIILRGVQRWGAAFRNHRVEIVTDNMQALACVNTGRSKNKNCMSWLRELFWCCVIYNIQLWATYINTKDNILADQLSRLAYNGVPEKCTETLKAKGMCCS